MRGHMGPELDRPASSMAIARRSVVPSLVPRSTVSLLPAARASLGALKPLVLACGNLRPDSLRVLSGRPIDLVTVSGPAQALRMAEKLEPVACYVSASIEGGDPARLIAAIARLEDAPMCVAVLDDHSWSHAAACRSAGAHHVVHADEWRTLVQTLEKHVPELYSRATRADATMPLVVAVGNASYAVESVDLRESGIAIRGFPEVPVGRLVRLRLSVDDADVWLRGEVARVFERDGTRIVAVRFLDLDAETQSWIARIIARLTVDGPDAFDMECWRADVRRMLSRSFGAESVPPPAPIALPAPISLVPLAAHEPEAPRAVRPAGAVRSALQRMFRRG